jgi:hypothetical protein
VITTLISNEPYMALQNAYNPRKMYDSIMNRIIDRDTYELSINLQDEIMRESGIGNHVDISI